MKHTLITFLGKGSLSLNAYDEVEYDGFLDEKGNPYRETTRFFGLALCKNVKPDQLIILGTPASMWNVLYDIVRDDRKLISEYRYQRDMLGLVLEQNAECLAGQEQNIASHLDALKAFLDLHLDKLLGYRRRKISVSWSKSNTGRVLKNNTKLSGRLSSCPQSKPDRP